MTEEALDKMFDLNAKGTFFTVQKALPPLHDNGSIIMTCTIATLMGMPNLSAYGAGKAGQFVFDRAWTNELKLRGIRVNVLNTGPTETAVFKGNEDMKAYMASQIPMGRLGQRGEIATTALFLATPASSPAARYALMDV